ncbi:MAG: SDR family NAD(P)-dependent oxidoreductase [Actinomycetota bacterium]
MTKRLEGKACIVTGAGRGIGLAIVRAFAAEGAQVVVNDMDAGAAEAAVKEITAAGGEAVANLEPIGTVAAAESVLHSSLDAFGRLDVLVNNAGMLRDKMTHTMTEEDFDLVVKVHLKGTWACGRAALQHWRPLAKEEAESGEPRYRKIINVTSASGLIGAAGQANYAAAKMGIVGLTKTWAKESGRLNINVNAIAPAALTAMTEPLVQDPEAAKPRLARFAMGRYGRPEEIAPSFVFLACKDSDYITGQVLCVDGGLVI